MSNQPKRVQRKRTKGWKMPEGCVYVGRPTVFGNPFTPEKAAEVGYVGDCHKLAALAFGQWIRGKGLWWHGLEANERALAIMRRLPELRGKDLACWCGLDKPCHADTLLELANQPIAAKDNQ